MKNKLLSLSVVAILALVGCQNMGDKIKQELQAKRAELVKSDNDLIGKRFVVPRTGQESVKINIHTPKTPASNQPMPVIYHIHGGAFVGGDADLLDTMSQRMADNYGATLVTVNYTKADIKPKEYAIDEIKDTILYFAENAKQFHIDPNKSILLGYSAGAYHSASVAIELQKAGFKLHQQILFYPYIGDNAEKIQALADNGVPLAPAVIAIAQKDADFINQPAYQYRQLLSNKGIQVIEKTYADALHGFVEMNNPEYLIPQFTQNKETNQVMNATQMNIARQAENDIGQWIKY